MAKNAVIIVAAGRGLRAGSSGGEPKQYEVMGARTVLDMTVDAFDQHAEVDLIQVVIHSDDLVRYESSVQPRDSILPPVFGGETRQQSVLAGLQALKAIAPINVLIHDAARPFVGQSTIGDVLQAIDEGVCALPANAQADTMKRVDDAEFVVETISRDKVFCAQTPQGFRYNEILAAHMAANQQGKTDLTDDAAVAEAEGMKVRIVHAPSSNWKITTKEDLELARQQLSAALPDVRTGHGYDVHTLIGGDGVVICGVEIPFDRALSGHSDADIGLHALTDALLGSIGDGDIGQHFPPTDQQWRGASSDIFLIEAVRRVGASGGSIRHVDITIICEAPKIGPHREAMRDSVAHLVGLERARVSVKATTHERIGAIGRGEGIAAMATATVVFMTGKA